MFTSLVSPSSRRKQLSHAKRRRFLVEQLEARQLLAVDFVVDAPTKDLELQVAFGKIQVIDVADNSVVKEVAIGETIDSKLFDITGASLIVDSTVSLAGNSLNVTANQITLTAGTITTANANTNSGNIALSAKQIIIGPGSILNTRAADAGGFASGTVTLIASDRAGDFESEFAEFINIASVSARSAMIDLSGATILAADVTIKADGITANRWDDVGAFKDNVGTQLLDQLQAIPQIGISAISPLSGQVKVHESNAEINLLNSTITSSGSVTISATAAADASINAVAINGTRADSSKILVSLAFSTSMSSATVGIDGTTTITSDERVDITTHATSKSKVLARADANTRASSSSVAGAFNLAAAYTTETSIINLAPGASINAGGTVKIDAKGEVNNDVKATTAIFQDGTGGLSASIGVDIANVKAIVQGNITSAATGGGEPLSFGQAAVDAATDSITLSSIPAANPLILGERLTYTAGAAELGLVDGVQYIVYAVTDPVPSATAGLVTQTVKLVAAETIDLDERQVPDDSEHTLTRLATIQFTEIDVSAEASGDGLITLAGLPAHVTKLVYLGPDLEANQDATGIVGLVQNQTYEIERTSAGAVKLKLPGTTELIDFVAPAAGTQGFYYTESVKTFTPSTAVDRVNNTIELPAGHGLKTGDLVFYDTDATRTIERAIEDFGEGDTSTGELGRVNLPDAPIRGLDDEGGYHVVIDAAEPNKIRLTTSVFAAASAAIQNLQPNAGSGHSFAREAVMQQGIIVNASLVANNAANAGVTLSDKEQPWAEVAFGAAGGDPDKIATGGYGLINALRSKINENTVDKAKDQTGSENDSRKDVDLAGSLAFTYFDHDVESRIATGAKLTSASDLIVDGKITQKTKLTSAASATRRGVDDDENTTDPRKDADPNDDGDTEISVAIAVGIYHNDATALVDSGAQINANRHTSVQSAVDYPLLASSVTEAINPLATLQSGGLGGVGSMLDGAAGLSQIFNMSISTIAGAPGDKLVLAAGVGVTEFNNNVTARIASNALVNQNVDLATHDPSISVTSKLSGDLIEVGQMAAFNLDVKGFIEAIQGGKIKDPLGTLKQLANPFGISGKNAAGGVFLVTLANNQTIAEIQTGAKVKAAGKVTVAADSDFYNVAVVQTGANATNFGFSASITAADIDNKTHAYIADGAIIVAGSLHIKATDTLNRISIAGAILKGKQTGIGASVGVNLIDQDVAAYAGRAATGTDVNAPVDVTLNISGAIDVIAAADGDLFALVMAGALQGFGKNPSSADAGGATTKANAKQIGPVALTIPVAINSVTTNVLAYLDHQHVRSLDVNLKADSMVDIQSIVVGASFGLQTAATGNGKLNLAGAGAVGVNTVVQNLAAFINDSDVQTTGGRGIGIKTADKSSVEADSGGFGITLSTSEDGRAAISFSVSFAINDISGTNSAFVDGSIVNALTGEIFVDATSESRSKSLAIAGGLSARTGSGDAGSFGGAGAIAINGIEKSVTAGILNNSNATTQDGMIKVFATDKSEIRADAGGVGISLSGGSGKSIAGAVGIGVALNEITNTIEAKIDGSEVNGKGRVDVSAQSIGAKISALAVAASAGVAAGGGLSASLSGAGSGANNVINNKIFATIHNSTVNASASGGVAVQAIDRSLISSTAIGAAIGAAASGSAGVALAVGVSISLNEIGTQAIGSVTDSIVTTDHFQGINVLAHQEASITSTAVAASVAVGFGSTGVGVSGAGAGAVNQISNKTIAFVDGSQATSAFGMRVTAKDKATIKSDIVAAAAAVGAGTTGIGAAFGFSYAENRIGDADTFSDDPTSVGAARAAQVKAYINDSALSVNSALFLLAEAIGSITSNVAAASVAAASGANSGAAAGAGVAASNDIAVEMVSLIQDSTGDGIRLGKLTMMTDNQSTVTSQVAAATLAVSVGVHSGSVAVAVSDTTTTIENKLQTAIRRSTIETTGNVEVLANENPTVNATATAAAAAAAASIGVSLSGGGAIASGTIASIVSATISDSNVDTTGNVEIPGDLHVNATSKAISDIQTTSTSISVGLIGLAANGSTATSRIVPAVDASVTGSNIEGRLLGLNAINRPLATADAAGLAASTGLAVGVSTAMVELGGTVGASLDSAGKSVAVEGLTMFARNKQETSSRAFAQGAAGGILIGLDATITQATNTTNVKAEIGANSIINVTGDVGIYAENTTMQDADSSSFGLGLVAAGITTAVASTNVATTARIGSGAQLNAQRLTVDASGRDQNTANTKSGSAGAISGAVALPRTHSQSNVLSEIADDAQVNVSGSIYMPANYVAAFNSQLTASAGGLLSGGGGDIDNEVVSDVVSRIGDRTTVTADSLVATANNAVDKADLGTSGNVDATAGGIIAGVGVDSDTDLTLRTLVEIGNAAELTIGNSITDFVTLSAKNIIHASDQLTLRSGGVAAGGINNSSIRTLVDDARVLILGNAKIDAAGSINASARGEGVISIQANSETYGGATVGAGLSAIHVTPRNIVNVGPGAAITALGDIDFSSGTDTQGNEDVYDINSRVDTFAGSAIPIDIMDATAHLLQDNQINIFAGANVRSAGNIRLHAERFGDPQIKAQVKAVNWTTGLTSAIDGLFAEGGTEQFKGTAVTDAVGTVRIDGNVETGIRRNQVLEIDRVTRANVPAGTPDTPDLFTVVLSTRSTDGIRFSNTLTPVTSSLDVALAEAYKNLELYDENSTLSDFYNNEITRINAKLAAQGLLETPPGAPAGTLVPVQRQTLTLVVDPIIAQAGTINIVGDELVGSGMVEAPGDASVEIINRSFASLDLKGIRIPDQNGGVFFNSENISETDSAVPFILVDNVADVTSPELTGNGSFALTWPGITVSDGGVIENFGGDVTLRNFTAGAGNILVNGSILAGTPRILAGNQGAAAFNSGANVSAPYSTGGEAYKNWNALTQGGFGVDGQPIGPGTGILSIPLPRPGKPDTTLQDFLNQIPDTVNVFGNRIFVSAQYINLNGVMQSGTDVYELIIGTETDNEIESLRSSGATGIRSLTSVSNPDFILRYNFETDRIIVEEVRSGGGYIDLTGNISNTHNGELRVLGGYSRINIDNRTDHDLQLKRLDVSQRGDGVVIIKDLNKGTAANPGVSIYRVEGDSVHAETPEGSQTKPGLNNEFLYIPKAGLRYGWSVGQDLMTRTETTYRSSSFLGFDALAADPDNIFKIESFPASTPRLLESGAYFYTDTRSTIGDYDFGSIFYNYQDKTSDGGSSSGGVSVFGLSLSGYYERTQIHETGTRFIATHSVKADRPVDIKFLGRLEGSISITSNGTVFVSGTLSNVSGSTTIRSNKGGVQQLEGGLVGGKTIQVTAVGGPIGSSESPLLTNVSDRLPHDFVSNRGDAGTTTTVAPLQFVLVASDHTAGGTPGSVYRFSGTRADLDLRNQNFSDTSRWVVPPFLPSIGLQTNSSDITAREIQGDMPVEIVAVSSTTVSATGGDVSLTAQGSIVRSVGPFSALDSFVIGSSVNLIAETGSIGSKDNPLEVSTDFLNPIKNPENRLSASAAGDITLEMADSTTIDRVVAGGDVRIKVSRGDGSIGATLIDGNTVAVRDERAIEEVAQLVWGDLQLTVDLGANEKINERIAAIIATRNQSYEAYWNFRSQQPDPAVYDQSFRVSLAVDERVFYVNQLRDQGVSQGLSGNALDDFVTAGITSLEDNRTTQYHSLHDDWGSLGDAFDPEFSYALTDDEIADVNATTKIWTVEELLNLQSAAFLNVTDTEFVIEEPNIVGNNIDLIIADGIGRYDNGRTIELFNEDGSKALLTIDERAAIAAAEPGDIVFLTQAPSEVVAGISGNRITLANSSVTYNWKSLGFVPGQQIYLESNTRDTTDEGIFYLISSLSVDGATMSLDLSGDDTPSSLQRDDPRPIRVAPAIADPADRSAATHLRVLRREDIDLRADGIVNAKSNGHIFLGSDSDLRLGLIQAGTFFDTNQRVQIKTDGAILDASDSYHPNVIGRKIVLESSAKNIGTVETPLQIDTTRDSSGDNFGVPDQANPTKNGYLIARAQNEVVISELHIDPDEDPEDRKTFAGEMFVNQVFSKDSFVRLFSEQAILDAFDSAETNVRAKEIILRSFDAIGMIENAVGRPANSLEIDLIDDGLLTAFSFGNIHLTENAGNLNLRHVHSRNGNVVLIADGSILDAVDVADPFQLFPAEGDADPMVSGNPVADVVALSVSLTSKHGSIGVAGNEVDTDTLPPRFNPDLGRLEFFTLTTWSALDTYVIEAPEDGVPNDLYLKSVTTLNGTAFISAPGGRIFNEAPAGETNLFANAIDFGAGWKPLQPQLIAGLFTHIITDGTETFQVQNETPYLNPANQYDVNSSGDITALDALIIINRLADTDRPDLTAPITELALAGFLYLDVNNDQKVTALDALVIINALARQGESEAIQTEPTALAAGLAPKNLAVPTLADQQSKQQKRAFEQAFVEIDELLTAPALAFSDLDFSSDHLIKWYGSTKDHKSNDADRWATDDEFLDDLTRFGLDLLEHRQ